MPKKSSCQCAKCKHRRKMRKMKAGELAMGGKTRQYRTNNSNLSGGASKEMLHALVDNMTGGGAKGLLADLLKGIDARIKIN